MKLQSPDYNGTNGYQIQLPVTNDNYVGSSMAAIIPLFDGVNKTLDFRQYREVITLVGVLTVPAAAEAGFASPLQMRDEMMRIRGARANFGKNTGASKSWLNECSAAFPRASAATWTDAPEPDASTSRAEATCRLVYDKYYNPTTGLEADLFAYGTVDNVSFARPGATTRTRIPFTVNFLVGQVKV